MRRTVIIYGGAFNPPTNAHQEIIQYLAHRAENMDAELWILPSGSRADKTIDVSPHVRLAYVDALISGIRETHTFIRIETSEIMQTARTETIDTVNRMNSAFPNIRFIWVFGADSIDTMKQWRCGAWLYENLDMWLITRHGYTLKDLPPKAELIPVKTQVVSSTKVRDYLCQGRSVRALVPVKVFQLLLISSADHVKTS